MGAWSDLLARWRQTRAPRETRELARAAGAAVLPGGSARHRPGLLTMLLLALGLALLLLLVHPGVGATAPVIGATAPVVGTAWLAN